MKVYEYLEDPKYWIKNKLYGDSVNERRQSCLLGALTKCYPIPSEVFNLVFKRLEKAIFLLYPERANYSSVTVFNDHPDTTHEDVLRVAKFADV